MNAKMIIGICLVVFIVAGLISRKLLLMSISRNAPTGLSLLSRHAPRIESGGENKE